MNFGALETHDFMKKRKFGGKRAFIFFGMMAARYMKSPEELDRKAAAMIRNGLPQWAIDAFRDGIHLELWTSRNNEPSRMILI